MQVETQLILVSAREAARMLGVSRSRLYALVHEGRLERIPVAHPSHTVFVFRLSDVTGLAARRTAWKERTQRRY